jgi:hypothetical protein
MVRLVHNALRVGFNGETSRCLPKRSMLTAAYSLLAGGPIVTTYAMEGYLDWIEWRWRYYHDIDLIFDYVDTGHVQCSKKVFEGLPYPGRYVSLSQATEPRLEAGAVVYFLSSDYLAGYVSKEKYWTHQEQILDRLGRLPGSPPVYVKAHPAEPESGVEGLRQQGYRVIDKEFSAEQVLIANKDRIRGVWSTLSTASLIAACVGIPAYHTYSLLKYPPRVCRAFDAIYSQASQAPNWLRKVAAWDELEPVRGAFRPDAGSTDHEKWASCLTSLFEMVDARVRTRQVPSMRGVG